MKNLFDLSFPLIFGIIWICCSLYLRQKKNKSYTYLLFFTIFFIYFYNVLDYTIFEFQSLILLKLFIPNLILNGQSAGESLNLIPLITLRTQDLETSLLNILLFVPFGFGLPFITSFRMKKVVILGAVVSFLIEVLQFLTGLLGKVNFRVADVNDVIFNTAGVAIGYLIFVVFMHSYRRKFNTQDKLTHPILKHIADRPQQKITT